MNTQRSGAARRGRPDRGPEYRAPDGPAGRRGARDRLRLLGVEQTYVQSAADASALAGASGIPAGASSTNTFARTDKQVNGVFVNLDSSPSMGTPGPYDPSSNTAYTVELTQ